MLFCKLILLIHIWTLGLSGIETSYVQTHKACLKYFSRPFLLMPWTMDLSIDYRSYSRSWSCLVIGIVRESDVRDCLVVENVSTIDFGYCLLTGFVRTVVVDCLSIGSVWPFDVWSFLTIEIARSNYFGVYPLFGIILTVDFRDCPSIGISWTIDVWCFN